jgi:hypothetical protein
MKSVAAGAAVVPASWSILNIVVGSGRSAVGRTCPLLTADC